MKPTAEPVNSARPSIFDRHRTLARLGLAVMVPLLFLGTAEGLLRLTGFGYPTQLYLPVEEVEAYGANRHFGWRFWPREIARYPIPQNFSLTKPERTCRIFTLGASAALGVPNPAFSFSRSLEVMLQARYPGVRFEFVNTSMTAINSHVVLPIASECAGYEPDVFLVYLGNNEFIGPFGPGTTVDGSAGNLRAIRAGLALREWRLGQLMQQVAERGREKAVANEQWRGMQQYTRHKMRRDDPALASVQDNFQRNLQDICRAGTGAGAKVVLSTVAVNLRDSPPFASVADSAASASDLRRLQRLEQEARQLLARGQPRAARDSLLAARALDDGCANIHYLLGKAALALGDTAGAQGAFGEALQCDALRFRTDRRLNEIIRSTATALASTGVLLSDTEKFLRQHEPTGTGLPGNELFYEHVHLNFEGNYLVARALLPVVEQALPTWVQAYRASTVPVPTVADCGRELMFTSANEYLNLSQMRQMVTPYPFTAQLGHEEMLRAIDEQMGLLIAMATPEVQRQTVSAYQAACRRHPDDLLLAFNCAKILALAGDVQGSNDVFQKIAATQPPGTALDAAAFEGGSVSR